MKKKKRRERSTSRDTTYEAGSDSAACVLDVGEAAILVGGDLFGTVTSIILLRDGGEIERLSTTCNLSSGEGAGGEVTVDDGDDSVVIGGSAIPPPFVPLAPCDDNPVPIGRG